MIVEFDLKGTHQGPLRGLAPTGKEFACRTVAFVLFEQDRLVCERVYFDAATILSQLGLIAPAPSLEDRCTTPTCS
ncbi:MAG TPA: ester cyclase [Thermoleophilaceae bacterium]|nr:ester cyclase [Thermoleophilaceae bacterium]